VFDGFPRTVFQAHELERLLNGTPLDVVVNLDIPTEIAVERIAGRRVCNECGRVYHVSAPPKVNWTCDNPDHGAVVQRDDDSEEAVMRRLELYETQTKPIIDFYDKRGMLVVVDGVGDGDEVFERILKAVQTRLAGD
jgi:adenylate kinase